jgi:hypothetical protein
VRFAFHLTGIFCNFGTLNLNPWSMFFRFFLLLLVLSLNALHAQVTVSKKNGKYTTFDNDVKTEGVASNYTVSGKCTQSRKTGYDANGEPVWTVTKICTYKKGFLEGKYMEFDTDGDTTVAGTYRNDKKNRRVENIPEEEPHLALQLCRRKLYGMADVL